MKTLFEFKERESGGKVEIFLPNGYCFRITFEDALDFIRVQTVDGSMSILPSVSNEIKILTNPNT
jgi:F0F1-type ATP synthase epsilon subunit